MSREYRMPCVAGTQVGTTVVKDGMLITVDGSQGGGARPLAGLETCNPIWEFQGNVQSRILPRGGLLMSVNPRLKITDVKSVSFKEYRTIGEMEPAWDPGRSRPQHFGAESFVEVHTDQGLTGIGPAVYMQRRRLNSRRES